MRFMWIFTTILTMQNALYVNKRGQGLKIVPVDEIDQGVTSLNLAHNQISSLEAYQFQNYELRHTLDLSHNDISKISHSAFLGLNALARLWLSSNKLTGMPYLGYIANNIKWIYLHNNPNIKTLNFSHLQMNNLIYLNLQNTGLTSMPISLLNAPELKEMNIQSNKIEFLPDGCFEKFTKLEKLYISRNNIQTFDPITLGLSSSLENLRAEGNDLSNLTEGSFKNLTGLKQLYLQDNSLTEFNVTGLTDGRGFPHLTHLYLSGNKLNILPSTEQVSDSLQYLSVASMAVGSVSADYFDDLNQLIRLDLQDNELENFPHFSKNMTKLQYLYLHGNKITFVDYHLFKKLPFLRILHLQNNKLQHFEIPRPGIKSLESLQLGYNKLQEFPNITSSIKSIKYLHIENNNIKEISMKTIYGSSIPEERAENMLQLYMHSNDITGYEIDDDIWHTMPNLQELQIYAMNLKAFPNLHPLEKLTKLWAHRNSFQSMGLLKNLKAIKGLSLLNLSQNNLSSIVNFVQLAEMVTSSELTVYLQHNNLYCNVDIFWMKYMDRYPQCY